MKLKNLVLISIFAALTAVGAFIKIPTPICPITLQILFTTLAGVLLGGRNGAASVAVYVLLGLLGVPVFTGGGGLHYVLQPTFGFLLGFIIGTYVTGRICHGGKPTLKRLIIGCLTGMLPVFALGTVYNCIITCLYMNAEASAVTVIYHCLMPFPGDVVLCVFTAILGKRLMPVLERMNVYEHTEACR
ncbi:MAG: biotin transporter BioY [Ruminococcus sp.]|nr:biotin transporter BioY [Ruminococcus sp.]